MNRDELVAKARDVDTLFYMLMDDVLSAAEIWRERDNGFSHRLYVRTAFASAEGVIQVMKSATLLFDKLNESSVLTNEDILYLREKEEYYGIDGNIKFKKRTISLLANFEFALITYAKVRGESVVLNKGGQGWESLLHALKVRNKLVHPHAPEDLYVSRKDMEMVERGMRFFQHTTAQLLHK